MELDRAGPPAKRLCLSDRSPVALTMNPRRQDRPKKAYSEYLACHVAPLAVIAVSHLPPSRYRIEALAVDCVNLLMNSFRVQFDENGGYLNRADEQAVLALVGRTASRLMHKPEYQIKAPVQTRDRPVARLVPPNRLPVPLHSIEQRQLPTPVPTPVKLTIPAVRSTRYAVSVLQPHRSQTPRNPIYSTRSGSGVGHSGRKRPYLCASDRQIVVANLHEVPKEALEEYEDEPYHVDFTQREIADLVRCVALCHPKPGSVPRTLDGLYRICLQGLHVPTLAKDCLPGRSADDLTNFCSDVLSQRAAHPRDARCLSLRSATTPLVSSDAAKSQRATRLSNLLMARELEGDKGFGRTRQLANFRNEVAVIREEDMSCVAEFTNCSGDIVTISWLSNTGLVCGCTAHSDDQNQQYNKPGNLLICSMAQGKLRALPDHRILRPFVAKGDNATDAMRQSQDPWLYTSVVASDHDKARNLVYTAAFDKTVKIWSAEPDGSSMTCEGTWAHNGKVNFVAVAKGISARVATAADTSTCAVRVYSVNCYQPSRSTYVPISCTRTDAQDSDKWAYHPATMQWGIAPGTQHLLAIGYSPRSLSGDDNDIPEDKRNTGEIIIWNADTRTAVPVLTASTANVFEIVWHPTRMRFIVATSPCGLNVDAGVRTQIHLFDATGVDRPYSQYQSLDCPALDINELTIKPNSLQHAYVTASCTDGNVYVWDTAQGDKPVHVLRHGPPLEEPLHSREREDCGVNLTLWGSTPDRFYSGSSDGVVKVWNVRNRKRPFVRDLLQASGAISCGAFSPDMTKLAIGDATGRLYLFSVNEEDAIQSQLIRIPGRSEPIRMPQQYIPHPEPEPPIDIDADDDSNEHVATYARRVYLDTGQLVLHGDRAIGAVKGPNYHLTSLFRAEAHLDNDPSGPLLTAFERHQQDAQPKRRKAAPRLQEITPAAADAHAANAARDVDPLAGLEDALLEKLRIDGAVLDWSADLDFEE